MPHLLFMMPVISLSVRQGGPFGFLNCFKVISFIAETTSDGRGCVSMSIFMPPKELWEAYSNRTVRPSVSPSVPLSCPVRISYILWGRNSKFGVWIHLGMAECRVPFSGHCDLDLDL